MRKNLLKNMILALLLTAAVPTLTAQVHVGDILCEGNAIISPANYPSSGATAIGVVFYVDNTGQHGWAVALEDAGSFSWGACYDDTPLLNYGSKRQAIYDLDGYHNTQIILACGTNYPVFYAVDFENGWYVPTIGQINYLYGNLTEVYASFGVVGGSQYGEDWEYWSSTESGPHSAWYMSSSGELFTGSAYDTKGVSRRVRAARNF